MLYQSSIAKTLNAEAALDHMQLYAQGLGRVQDLSSRIWTDYNVHDPGITILELFCYALTDLSFRASYPVEDLLAAEANPPNAGKQFCTARDILPNRPLTLLDYRKLLIDIPGVKNAWVQAANSFYYADTIEGQLLGPATLLEGEIVNLPSFAAKMKQPADALTKYLGGQLSPETTQALASYSGAADDPNLQAAPVRELNRVIRGGSLYDPLRFTGVTLSTVTEALRVKNPTGGDLWRLNRLLLEDAYPLEIGKNQPLRDRADLPGVKQLNLRGLYEVSIEFMDEVTSTPAKAAVMVLVKTKVQGNRNLCEDFVGFQEVETQDFLLCCELSLAPNADEARVQAEIFLAAEKYLAPPIYNYTLEEMEARQHADGTPFTADEIFDGPALECGFLDTDEVNNANLRTEIHLSQVIAAIMDIQGVEAIKDIVMNPAPGTLPTANKWIVPVAAGKKAVLDRTTSRLLFYKRNMPVKPAPGMVNQWLDEIAGTERKKFEDTKAKEDLPIPPGTYRQRGEYYSFQHHFPVIYGLSDEGLSPASDSARNALAYQLKAYLLFFDQIMANGMAQIDHVRDLFSTDAKQSQTYFCQTVNSFTGYLDLYRGAITQWGVEAPDLFASRRNRFLDHLMARFAESFTDFANILQSAFKTDPKTMAGLKCDFLNSYPEISSNRARAYNRTLKTYLDLWNSENISGLEKRLAKLLGIALDARRNLGDPPTASDNGEGMYLIEFLLLRPEAMDDHCLPIYPDPNCTECDGDDPYSYRLQIILPADTGRFQNMDFRIYAESVIRAETPAHILPKVCWVRQADMQLLEKAYRDWIYVQAGADTTQRSVKVNALIDLLFKIKNVYPAQKLQACGPGDGQTKFLLGRTALGTITPKPGP